MVSVYEKNIQNMKKLYKHPNKLKPQINLTLIYKIPAFHRGISAFLQV